MTATDNAPDTLIDQIRDRHGARIADVVRDRGQVTLVVNPEDAHDILASLRDDYGFDFPVDLSAVDYRDWPVEGEHPERFAVVYMLSSLARNKRLRVKAYLNELEPSIRSTADLFGCNDWLEREVYDMYGIRFTGHPNLIRILCPDNLKGHALRKEYPLTGRGEREDFPVYHTDQP